VLVTRWNNGSCSSGSTRAPDVNTARSSRKPSLLRPYGPTLTAELRHRVHALLRCGQREIVVDVGRLSSIDAAGVGQLVRAYNVTRALKGVLRLANATARVREALERVGLFDVLSAGE
jgi:anti-anti-sigma factor